MCESENPTYYGLSQMFEKDEEVKKFICENDIEEVIRLCISSYGKDKYILNLISAEQWAAMPVEGERWMAKRQLDIYMPIIKYFLLHGFKDILKFKVLTEPLYKKQQGNK